MYKLDFSAYCGMSYNIASGELSEIRKKAAGVLKSRKRNGHFIHKLRKNAWECQEPEGCFMVPDSAGILVLSEESHDEFDSEELNDEGEFFDTEIERD